MGMDEKQPEDHERILTDKDSIISSQKTQILKSSREITFMRPFFLKKVHEHYKDVIEKLKVKVASGKKIRVAYIIMYDSIFPGKLLFEAMEKDPLFDPALVVVNLYTDYYNYSSEQVINTYNKTYDMLSKEYPEASIIKSYDPDQNTYKDIGKDFDIIFPETFYMHMYHPYYLCSHFLNYDILTININYGYIVAQHTMYAIETIPYSTYWKVFAENNIFKEDASKYDQIKGENIIVTGHLRMDNLAKYENKVNTPDPRKKIIIALHHAGIINVAKKVAPNFFKYSDFFLKLPTLYPEIDFIYRPHPFAMDSFATYDGWDIERTNRYVETLKANPNVIYSSTGEHIPLFAQADGIIHDCGSFLTEYLFTGKPACYIMEEGDQNHLEKYLNVLGQASIKHYYNAYSEKDMINFIENIVINGNDPMKEARTNFTNKELRVNYPHVTDTILNYIKKELGVL